MTSRRRERLPGEPVPQNSDAAVGEEIDYYLMRRAEELEDAPRVAP